MGSQNQGFSSRQFDLKPLPFLARAAITFALVLLVIGLHRVLYPLMDNGFHALMVIPVLVSGLLLGYRGSLAASAVVIGLDLGLFHLSAGQRPWDDLSLEVSLNLGLLVAAGLGMSFLRHLWLALQDELRKRAATEQELRAGQETRQALIESANRHARGMELLAQVHTALSRELDPQVIFRTVVESLSSTFHYRLISVYKLGEDGSLYLQHQVGYDQEVPVIPRGQGVVSRCVELGQPLLVADVRSDPRYINALSTVGSEISVPLFSQGQVVGVLNIENEHDRPLGDYDLNLMTQLGEYITISLDRARLYQAEREQRTLAEALHRTARTINRSLELDEVLASILANLDRVIACEAAGMVLDDPQGARLLIRDRGAAEVREVALPETFSIHEIPALRQMASSGRPMIVPDQKADPSFSRFAKMEWIGSMIGVPVRVKEQVLGFLLLASSQPGFFDLEHAERLQIFVEQSGAAIENARLYTSAQRQARYLAVLNEITRLGVSATHPEEIFQGLADHLAALIGADSAYISRWDESRQMPVPVAAHGPLQKTYAGLDIEPGEATMTSKVLEMGQSLVVEDVQHSPFLSPRLAVRFPIFSVLTLPLIADGRRLGAVLLAFEKRHLFTPEEVALCEQAAGQAALAVSKALLIAQIEQLAITDELTGLYNHRGLMELGRREVERALRFGRPLAAIMLDIDHFKTVNDRFGHPLGNQTLRVLAERCKANIREIDILGRYGGEEFVVLLPENNAEEGRQVAERLRSIIAAMAIHTRQGDIHITVSLGVAEVDGGVADLATLIERSDQALYQAKNAGRNCVAVWGR